MHSKRHRASRLRCYMTFSSCLHSSPLFSEMAEIPASSTSWDGNRVVACMSIAIKRDFLRLPFLMHDVHLAMKVVNYSYQNDVLRSLPCNFVGNSRNIQNWISDDARRRPEVVQRSRMRCNRVAFKLGALVIRKLIKFSEQSARCLTHLHDLWWIYFKGSSSAR